MKSRVLLLFFLYLIQIYCVHAQSAIGLGLGSGNKPNTRIIELKSGSFDFLIKQNYLVVNYDYSNMSVGNDLENEIDFLRMKTDELNASNSGKGDKWKQEWFEKRTTEYEPNFEILFNKYAQPLGLTCSKSYTGTEFIMNIHTTHTNIITFVDYSILSNSIKYIPSYINAEITFSRASTGENVATFILVNFTAESISESYSVLGKYFAKYLVKNL